MLDLVVQSHHLRVLEDMTVTFIGEPDRQALMVSKNTHAPNMLPRRDSNRCVVLAAAENIQNARLNSDAFDQALLTKTPQVGGSWISRTIMMVPQHHGLFTTIREAVIAHAGEALEQRRAFERLEEGDQESLMELLGSLQVLPPGTRELIVDEHYRPKRWSMAR